MLRFIREHSLLSGLGTLLVGLTITYIVTGTDDTDPESGSTVATPDQLYQGADARQVGVDTVTNERVSDLTCWDVISAIEDVPPLQVDQVKANYVGIRVDWTGSLLSASERDSGKVQILLMHSDSLVDIGIAFEVLLDDYRELRVAAEGTEMRVEGNIARFDQMVITLSEANLLLW